METTEVIERLKAVLGSTKDAELAEALGKHRNYVYSLRQRDSIPYEECMKVAHETGASLDWLLLGRSAKVEVATEASEGLDPRIGRLISFFTESQQTMSPDEIAWLEQHFRRTVPEYANWYEQEKDHF